MAKYEIGPTPDALSAEVVALLEQTEVATVGHWRHWGFCDRRIQPLLRRRRVAGTAITLAIPGPDSTLLHHALGLLRPGDILVVDRLGDDKYACWGGGVTVAAKAAGAKAGVVDGPCTDLEGDRGLRLPDMGARPRPYHHAPVRPRRKAEPSDLRRRRRRDAGGRGVVRRHRRGRARCP